MRETLASGRRRAALERGRQPLRAHRAGSAATGACAPEPSPSSPPCASSSSTACAEASRGYEIVSGDPLIRACRMIKSPAELALMQTANDVTIEALRHVHARVERGMSAADLGALMNGATVALGGSPEFALILLNEASAFPHGSLQPQTVREGLDHPDGLRLHGAGLSVRHLAHLGVRRAERRASARSGTPSSAARRSRSRPRRSASPPAQLDDAVRSLLRKRGLGPGLQAPGAVASHRPRHRARRP